MKRRYLILHIIAIIGFFIGNHALHYVASGEIQMPIIDVIILIFGALSTIGLFGVILPIDMFKLSRRLKPFPKVQASQAYSLISYIITLFLINAHIGVVPSVKKDFYDFIIEKIFNYNGRLILIFYSIVFFAILLGLDVLLRYLANRYIYDKK